VSLSAASHLSHEANGAYRHRDRRKLEFIAQENIT
jgi:hypothetical protein